MTTLATLGKVRYGINSVPDGESLVAAAFIGAGPVDPPPLTPNPVNLVRSSRNPSDDGDTRWTNGFSYLPLEAGTLGIYEDCGPNSVDVPNDVDADIIVWRPYVLSAEFECSMMGYDEAGYQARVKNLLDAATPKMVEYELWSGSLSQAAAYDNLYLKIGAHEAFAAGDIYQAIGLCEQYLASVGPGLRGMIHMPPYLAPYLQMVCRREGNLLLTNRDTIVVPGSGYNLDAAMPPAGTVPIFATGITDVRLGEIVPIPDNNLFYQGIDRSTNTIVVRAERYACASWDGVAFAQINLTLPATP